MALPEQLPNIRQYFVAGERLLDEVILAPRRQFLVPYNQRPWEWKETQCRQLWVDVVRTCNSWYPLPLNLPGEFKSATAHPHFFGAFVFEKTPDQPNRLEVVDGQQRLTAISLLASLFRQECHLIQACLADHAQKEAARNCAAHFTSWLQADDDPDGPLYRLVVDSAYIDVFNSVVTKPTSATERHELIQNLPEGWEQDRNAKAIKERFDYFAQLWETTFGDLEPAKKLEVLKNLRRTLCKLMFCIEAIVTAPGFSLEVFKCLNARGLSLKDPDKIKNELFLKANRDEHEQIRSKWENMRTRVPKGDVSSFLRLRHVALIGPCPKSKLYETVKSKELEGKNPSDVLKQWGNDAALFERFTLAKPGGLQKSTKVILQTIQDLGITYTYPLLLSAAKRYLPSSEKEFRKCAQLALNIGFRLVTIGHKDVQALESSIGEAARKLHQLEIDSDGIAPLFQKASPDAAFIKAFSEFSTNRPKLQYYILATIETHLNSHAGLEPRPHSPRQHIEHILPRNLSNAESRKTEWSFARHSKGKHKRYLNRLGNLLILEEDVNKDVSNYSFDAKRTGKYPGKNSRVKRKCYKDSAFKLAKQIQSKQSYNDWTWKSIDKRQNELAKVAVKTWSLTDS